MEIKKKTYYSKYNVKELVIISYNVVFILFLVSPIYNFYAKARPHKKSPV